MSSFSRLLSNIPGWRSTRKIVVIESDDWGSIRMPSLDVFRRLEQQGLDINRGDNKRFNTLDTLAGSDDLEYLFTTLRKYKDKNGRHPVITALALSANPDFDRIKKERFEEYFYESFSSTLERYELSGAMEMWQQGSKEGLFFPEFHGREHLNVKVWMDALKRGDEQTLKAFEYGFWGYRPKNEYGISYQAAFDLDTTETLEIQKSIVKDGLRLFEKLHGRAAQFFVPPNGAINQQVIDYAVTHGITFVSSPKIHKEPLGEKQHRNRYRYLGKRGPHQMVYFTRNAFFEPNYKGRGFSVADCLDHIKAAFLFRKPAIISTHRVNFVGGLSEQNRPDGNKALGELLTKILQKWPDVEFMTSTELGELIRDDS